MARGSKGRPTSKSALQQQDDEEAKRLKDVPLFSFEGLRVNQKKIAAYVVGALVVLFALSLALTSMTSAANVDLTADSTLGQGKPGDFVNFTVTVRNGATFSAFAYETHVVGLPTGWSASSGEDVFPLKAGESRAVAVSVATGAATPPGPSYPFAVKVLVKSGDLKTNLTSKALPMAVQVLASNLRLSFETRETYGAFAGGALTADLNFTACGGSTQLAYFSAPFDANFTSVGFTANIAASDPNATGNFGTDIGADGSVESNLTLGPGSTRVNVGPFGFSNYTAGHPATSGNVSVPVRFSSCFNATSWNVTLNNVILNYQRQRAPGDLTPVSVANAGSATGDAVFIARVTSGEARSLPVVLNLTNMPKGWDATPSLSSTPFPVPAHGSNTLEFTLRVAKTAPRGPIPVTFTACVQVNLFDCTSSAATLDMPPAPFFTVKTYVEPASLKEVYRGRSVDLLLFAQNLGNQPVGFDLNVPPRPGLSASWWDGSGSLSEGSTLELALNQSRLFVLRVTADASAPSSVYTLSPAFHNTTFALTQTLSFLSFNLLDTPASPKVLELGNRATVDFAGATEGALLFDTDIFSMIPLIDQGLRPTHPQYVKPTGGGLAPYQYTLLAAANYTNLEHKGFEASLAGMWEKETKVFWLTPDLTQYPQTAFLKDTTVVFEVRLSAVSPA